METKKIAIILFLFASISLKAQVSYVDTNGLKFDSTTNCQIRYVYFPNMCAYFDKLEKVYIYKENGEWIKSEELPVLYGGYSLYSNVGVEITNYDEEKPYTMLKQHKKMYPYNSKGHFTYQTVAIR